MQKSKSESGELDSVESNVRWRSEEQSHNEHDKKAYLLVVANVKFMFTRVLLSRLTSTKFSSVTRNYTRTCVSLLCPPLCLLVEDSIWTNVFKRKSPFHVSVSVSTLLRHLTLSTLLIM